MVILWMCAVLLFVNNYACNIHHLLHKQCAIVILGFKLPAKMERKQTNYYQYVHCM